MKLWFCHSCMPINEPIHISAGGSSDTKEVFKILPQISLICIAAPQSFEFNPGTKLSTEQSVNFRPFTTDPCTQTLLKYSILYEFLTFPRYIPCRIF